MDEEEERLFMYGAAAARRESRDRDARRDTRGAVESTIALGAAVVISLDRRSAMPEYIYSPRSSPVSDVRYVAEQGRGVCRSTMCVSAKRSA